MSYTVRLLPAAEWARLQTEGVWAVSGMTPPPVDACDVLVVEDGDGRIVGMQAITVFCHLEGLWTDPERPHVGILRRLWPAVQQQLQTMGVGVVYTVAASRDHEALFQHAGFERIPGVLMAKALGDGPCPSYPSSR